MNTFENACLEAQNWSGHTREKGVRFLGEMGDPIAIPHLLKRVNDWVPEIRELSLGFLLKLLNEECAESWLNILPDLYHLKNCKRADHSHLISKVEIFLGTQPKVLLDGSDNSQRRVRKSCLALVLKLRVIPLQRCIELYLDHKDLSHRISLAHQIANVDQSLRRGFIQRALKDKCSVVRRIAFMIGLEESFESVQLETLLLDNNATIRELSKSQLEARGLDVHGFYVNFLNRRGGRNDQIESAIYGIALFENAEDYSLVSPFLNVPRVSIRKAALSVSVHIKKEERGAMIRTALNDASPRVRKKAAQLARRYHVFFSAEELCQMSKQSKISLSTLSGLSMLNGKWEDLILLLFLHGKSDGAGLFPFMEHYRRWEREFNRSAMEPSLKQREIILKYTAALPNEPMYEFLRFLVHHMNA